MSCEDYSKKAFKIEFFGKSPWGFSKCVSFARHWLAAHTVRTALSNNNMKLYVTLLSGFLQDSVYYNSNHVLQSSKITWISFLILYNQMKIIWVHRKWEIEISIPAKTRNRIIDMWTHVIENCKHASMQESKFTSLEVCMYACLHIWHRLILPLPPPIRMVKNNFFLGKSKWLVKIDFVPEIWHTS